MRSLSFPQDNLIAVRVPGKMPFFARLKSVFSWWLRLFGTFIFVEGNSALLTGDLTFSKTPLPPSFPKEVDEMPEMTDRTGQSMKQYRDERDQTDESEDIYLIMKQLFSTKYVTFVSISV
jgi:hypothetical protein